MTRPGICVEFIGLPGSGKSTVSKQVAQALRDRGNRVASPVDWLVHEAPPARRRLTKLGRVAGEIVAHPDFAMRSAGAILSTRQGSITDLVKTGFNWLFVSAMVRFHLSSDGICILDEGVFQALWSIGFGARRERSVADVAARLDGRFPTPHMVVALETSLETTDRRLRGRVSGVSRLETRFGSDPEALRRSVSLFEQTMSLLRELSTRTDGIRLFAARNDIDVGLERTALTIADEIEIFFAAGRLARSE